MHEFEWEAKRAQLDHGGNPVRQGHLPIGTICDVLSQMIGIMNTLNGRRRAGPKTANPGGKKPSANPAVNNALSK